MTKVLIIEDEPNMVIGLKDSCEYEGYEVSVARNSVYAAIRSAAARGDRGQGGEAGRQADLPLHRADRGGDPDQVEPAA